MSLLLRPGTPNDLPALVEIANLISPQDLTSLASMQAREAVRRPDLLFVRLVAEQSGRVVGSATLAQNEWALEPGKFMLGVGVHPQWQGTGVGKALYQAIWQEAGQRQPTRLLAYTRENRPRALRFLAERDWRLIGRERPSAVQLDSADLSGLDAAVRRVQAEGYQIQTLAELQSDPGYQDKYHALDLDAGRDVPMPEGEVMTPPSAERFWQQVRSNPHFDPNLWFLALRDGQYAGVSQLYETDMPGVMHTGFTGVARAHRRQGLALALKLVALTQARKLGAHEVRTENDATNRPMLSINDALGFQALPAWLNYALDVGDASGGAGSGGMGSKRSG